MITPERRVVSLASAQSNHSAVQSSPHGGLDLLAGVDFERALLFVHSLQGNSSTAPLEPPAPLPTETIGDVQRSRVDLRLEWTSLEAPFRLDVVSGRPLARPLTFACRSSRPSVGRKPSDSHAPIANSQISFRANKSTIFFLI